MIDHIRKYKVILASRSPRRHQLLSGLGIDFEVIVGNDVPEVYPDNLHDEEIAIFLAELKARSFKPELDSGQLLITADTIVSINGEILGKPVDRTDAVRMIELLSGQMHKVITGVCIWSVNKKISFTDISSVWFSRLDEEEITWYVDHYKPYDKAGAYGVQEWIGYIGIDRVEGSFFNVMGLPVHRVYEELKKF
ncbi:MAG: Maf-like protein [Bacteroidia bacterium]|nr:Maf-like protein [Bacteroidia bacterium]